MMLDIDIGNTRLKWRSGLQRGFIATAGLSAEILRRAWGGVAAPERVRYVTVADDGVDRLLQDFCRSQWQLSAQKACTQAAQAGVVNSYLDYKTMGADRWLAMLSAFDRVRGGCCVVDCGSAVTVDYIDAAGQHLGGFIAPGLRLMRQGLLANTRQISLPQEPGRQFDTRPGRSTEEAVGHGIELMLAALAQRVVKDSQVWLGDGASLLVTGGDGERFLAAAGDGLWCADLVLDGLDLALSPESVE